MGYVAGAVGLFVWFVMVICSVAAWVTHVLVCIKTASWILLLFGCFVFPIGIIHGVGVWMGIF